MTVALHHDYETASDVDLKKHGLDRYMNDPSTRVLMCSYAFNNDPVKLWTPDHGPYPRELKEALLDPHVEKWAFNAQFERKAAQDVLDIATPIKNWRCTMALAYMQSFFGGLEQVGAQMALPQDKLKIADGKRLIRKFCMPQKVTKNQPLLWRDQYTDPEDWQLFCDYCVGDTVTERAIKQRLIKFPVGPGEWDVYELDQIINDRGVPVDMDFVNNAAWMSAKRKEELTYQMKRLTGLANPNSPKQLLAWLQERGYPFADMKKDTIKKVLTENAAEAKHEVEIVVEADETEDGEVETLVLPPAADGGFLDKEAVAAMKLRQQSARTSVKKYDTMKLIVGEGDRFRFGLQYGGASRTLRWAGRKFQFHNLGRPPKEMSLSKIAEAAGIPEDYHLNEVTEYIRTGDYDGLAFYLDEPMNALAGTVRSSIRAEEGHTLLACDLSSIETVVIAGVSGCERLLNVFRDGKDPYKDFGSRMYNVPYADVVGELRQDSKPAVLGCGFRLGGGDLYEGKKTGLWAYAEALGVNMSKDEAHRAVKLYRETYPEVPKLWYALEDAVKKAYHNPGRKVRPLIKIDGRTFQVPVLFQMNKPYMNIILPSGRMLYYYKPRITKSIMRGRPTPEYPEGQPWEKENFSYMGKMQNGTGWVRVMSHGGKITENIVQAIARDILVVGMRRAHAEGYPLIGHVHDELFCHIRKGSNYFTIEGLRECMTRTIDWCADWPLGAEGWIADFYRK